MKKRTLLCVGMLFVIGLVVCWKTTLYNDNEVCGYDKSKHPAQNCLYTLSVCSIFKDEAPYFKEWLEYYKLLGVQHFRLYNNESTDNYLEVLQPYIDAGEVTLIDWPSDLAHLGRDEWAWYTQLPACMDGIHHLQGVSEWVAILDLDEFIVPLEHNDLVSFLQDYKQYAGVLINWQNFGTSLQWEVPENKLMMEVLTLKAPVDSKYNHPVKSIVRPERVDTNSKAWCPHTWPYLSPEDKWIFPNKQPYQFGKVEISKIRINHYVHKTEEYFYYSKVAKKERMEGCKLTQEYINDWKSSCNQEEDFTIARFIPALRERVFPRTFVEKTP
ncbi:MAG: hypothetical protein FJZ58_05130 [Chlamydiae bacterium]|nr:hypothetical protein [Chlamydiota bacterium]